MTITKTADLPKEFFETLKIVYCPECGSQQRQTSEDHKLFSCDSCSHGWRIR